MPIGKNAIKRVSNNGYSKVASSAPDMENSTVAKAPVKEESEKAAPVSNKTTAKKAEPKKKSTPKSSTEAKKTVKTTPKAPAKAPENKATPRTVLKNESKNDNRVLDNGCINLGGEMPIYLL